jgi:hypothetical protein
MSRAYRASKAKLRNAQRRCKEMNFLWLQSNEVVYDGFFDRLLHKVVEKLGHAA